MTIKHLLFATLALLTSLTINANAVEPAQRIIALSPHSVELLYAIGAGERIVGTIDSADYPEAAKQLNFIGNYQGVVIEKIIALKPDLIIAWGGGNKINQIEQLKGLGFNVVNSDPKSLIDIAADIRRFGQWTGLNVNAEKVAQQYLQQLNAITEKYQTKQSISVFYQLWSRPLMTISNQSWINLFIDGCGATNVFATAQSAYPQVSIENVLLANPQVMLVPRDSHSRNHDLFDWQQWQHLDAVKRKHVYYPNGTLLHRPTPRVLTAMKELCQQIDQAR